MPEASQRCKAQPRRDSLQAINKIQQEFFIIQISLNSDQQQVREAGLSQEALCRPKPN
jgi:hypothetical protein